MYRNDIKREQCNAVSTYYSMHVLYIIVSTDLEVERLNCSELKKTWELANAHFVVAQDQLKQEIYRLHQKLERGDAARSAMQGYHFHSGMEVEAIGYNV